MNANNWPTRRLGSPMVSWDLGDSTILCHQENKGMSDEYFNPE